MRKFLKIILVILAIVIAGIAILAFYVKKALPNVGPPPVLKIVSTPARLERGQYLATHTAACIVCHSRRKEGFFGEPVYEDSLGIGGELFGKSDGFPGNIYAANLTPYHLGDWTDGELFRAITTGVSKDGHALFPIMNYPAYGKMDIEDIYSIIAYLRTLRPIPNDVPHTTLDFPLNFIVNTIPAPAALAPKPDSNSGVAYGKYLVDMASCKVCHSQENKGKLIPGTEFGGGRAFGRAHGKTIYSANITPDKETGIGNWTPELFVHKFSQYADSSYKPIPVIPGSSSPMPWIAFGAMKKSDLAAIFAYLQTLKPIHNVVSK